MMSATVFLLLFGLLIIGISYYHTTDDNNMDLFDHYVGLSGEGRTRGITGIIYNADGSMNVLLTIGDINPYYMH